MPELTNADVVRTPFGLGVRGILILDGVTRFAVEEDFSDLPMTDLCAADCVLRDTADEALFSVQAERRPS